MLVVVTPLPCPSLNRVSMILKQQALYIDPKDLNYELPTGGKPEVAFLGKAEMDGGYWTRVSDLPNRILWMF